jgi:hypothetical protein
MLAPLIQSPKSSRIAAGLPSPAESSTESRRHAKRIRFRFGAADSFYCGPNRECGDAICVCESLVKTLNFDLRIISAEVTGLIHSSSEF